MARPARHKIELNSEERSDLEKIARAEKLPWREVQRAKIVLYAAEGESDVDIAARLDTAAGIVGRWRRRFHVERLDGLKDRLRAGRPRRFGRRHPSTPPGPGRPLRCEFEYQRGGTLAYLAAWDVYHANLFGRVEEKTGIEPFGRLVEEVMATEPYASARRVFRVLDNGSSHAGQASIERLEGAYENLRLIHLPIHASWLNQIELYFSILQRKAPTPNDFGSREELTDRLLAFQARYAAIARPFEWTFTRTDLERVIARIDRQGRGRFALAARRLRDESQTGRG